MCTKVCRLTNYQCIEHELFIKHLIQPSQLLKRQLLPVIRIPLSVAN